MLKKISVFTVSVLIVVFGCIAFQKLNYWERSVRIFSLGNSEESADRRPGEELDRLDDREEFHGRDLHREVESDRKLIGVPSDERTVDVRDGDRHGPDGERSTINFGKVILFLAVFASSAVITIWIDKVYYGRQKIQSL
jgi:hypothetical protein